MNRPSATLQEHLWLNVNWEFPKHMYLPTEYIFPALLEHLSFTLSAPQILTKKKKQPDELINICIQENPLRFISLWIASGLISIIQWTELAVSLLNQSVSFWLHHKWWRPQTLVSGPLRSHTHHVSPKGYKWLSMHIKGFCVMLNSLTPTKM